jgi:glycosyltransferase involved in cell wall biosynthesis
MTRLEIPSWVEWELLVVNNNCSDSTDEVIASFEARLPIRRLFEPKQGKSHALNHAAREAKGEYILWTDDDVLVDRHWVRAYSEAFRCWPDAAFFGGPILPRFEGKPPAWVIRNLKWLGGVYAIRDLGEAPFEFGLDQYSQGVIPYGANFAVNTEHQLQHLYNSALGRKKDNPIRGEDTDLVYRILLSGARGRWVPDARVDHYIPGARQTTEYVRTICFFDGTLGGGILMDTKGRSFLSRPLWILLKGIEALRAECEYRLKRALHCKSEIWIERMVTASYAEGVLYGACWGVWLRLVPKLKKMFPKIPKVMPRSE